MELGSLLQPWLMGSFGKLSSNEVSCKHNVDTDEYFYVSYNGNCGHGMFDDDGSKPETALYYAKTDSFYILNGDFREQYKAVNSDKIDGYLAVFEANRKEHFCDFSSGSAFA